MKAVITHTWKGGQAMLTIFRGYPTLIITRRGRKKRVGACELVSNIPGYNRGPAATFVRAWAGETLPPLAQLRFAADYLATWPGGPQVEPALFIACRRKELGLTQTQVAGRAGVNQGHLCEIETGKYTPTIAMLKKLAPALNCQPSELL